MTRLEPLAGARAGGTPASLRATAAGWRRAALLAVGLNIAFAALSVATAALPREPFRERVRNAFAAGDLLQRDWISWDSRRGSHQYDECLILQMLTNDNPSLLSGAAGPRKYLRVDDDSGYCRNLHDLVVAGADHAGFNAFPYARYWHGYLPVTAAFLAVAELGTSRRLLKALSYGALLLLLVVSLRARGLLRVVGASFAVAGLAFWGLPYFGQLFAHAPGDIAVVLGIAGMIGFAHALRAENRVLLFGAAFGAGVTYMEFLTGQLPTAAALLFPAAYAVAAGDAERTLVDRWRFATVALLAFIGGAVLSVVLKQAFALAVLGREPFAAFAGNLQLYTGSVSEEGVEGGLVQVFIRLYRRAHTLTYGSGRGAQLLIACVALAWGFGAAMVFRKADPARRAVAASDLLALVVGAAGIIGWVLLLQTHTYFHARFMVRILMAPVALGIAAAVWALVAHRSGERATRGSAAGPLT